MNYNDKLAKIAVHKSLLKEYSNSSNERIVYMNDGTEFQIQIFNPYSYVIGISFGFNDNNNFNNQLLVLRPGERVWLDRYLNNESRLLFSTYEVGNSKAVKEAIKNNGNLCIKFYKEKEKKTYWYDNNIYINNAINAKPWNDVDVYYNSLPKSYCNGDASYSINTVDTAINTILTAAASDSVSVSASTCTYDSASTTTTASTAPLNKKISKSIETGRIEEGSHSNQKFNYVNKDFEYWPFKTEYIKILPISQKQINTNDLKKRYCHECGRKLNQKYKFCPYCGAQQ